MTARSETSITVQEVESELSGPSGMSVALIGPNDAHRKIVAEALRGSEATKVREFIDYPGQIADLPRMVGKGFDVVMIDVDSDESYALALIENIAATGRARVVAYSKRNNPELEASCLQAGALDLLPLPPDEEEESRRTSPPVAEDTARSEAVAPHPSEEQSAPEESIEKKAMDAKAGEAPPFRPRNNAPKLEPATYEFTDWDARFLRPPQPAVVVASDTKPQPAIARTGSRRMAARITPFESNPPVDEKGLSAVETHPPIVESTPAEIESRPTEIESYPPVDESHPSAVESDSPVVESRLPAVETPLPKIESRQPSVESRPSVIENPPAAVESRLPAVETPLPKVESRQPSVESRRSVIENPPAAVESRPPVIVSYPAAEMSRPAPIARTLLPLDWAADEPLPIKDEVIPVKKYEPLAISNGVASAIEDGDDDDEKPHRNWMKWVLIPTGLGLVAGFLVLVFVHPFRTDPKAAPQEQNVALQAETPDPAPEVPHSTPKSWKTIMEASARNPVEQGPAQQVSSDMMEAQLKAPSRISAVAEKPAPAEEPSAGLAPVAIDSGGSVPGTVFGGENKVKVVPGVSAISAGVAAGLLMRRTRPIYPAFARENDLSGTVLLGATITKTGKITGLRVLSGPSVFRSAALEAVKTWRYKPYMLNNQPVEVQTTISVVFNIGGH